MLPFINRELSWLDFNHRVLAEAFRDDNPLMDRLQFLSITSSNLDEFYMVRVAYLHDRSKSSAASDDSGLTPQQQLEEVLERTHAFQQRQDRCFAEIRSAMEAQGIRLVDMENLSETQQAFTRELFHDEISPVITPLAVDPSRPFPFLLNKSINIGVRLRDEDGENVFAVVQVPAILPRFIRLPAGSGCEYLPIELLIAHYLPSICDLHPIEAYGFFRITRSADFDADEDTDDLLEEMKRTLRKRKRGKPIRLELSDDFDGELRSFIGKTLRINRRYLVTVTGLMDYTALRKISGAKEHAALHRAAITPVRAADFAGAEDIFAAIRERDRMVHHPYQSFDHVVEFIAAAAADPAVLAIKQTLYRVSGKSRIITALEQAADAGKQVTVLVELKARFDEENNIQWARRLERAGCHVIYGLAGLKTHSKVTLVVRRESDGIRRYVHMATGNYNDVTARLYTDIGVFSCRQALGADASALFNHLTGFSKAPVYHKLIVAPEGMRDWFLHRVDTEIGNARKQISAFVSVKVNSLLDRAVIQKLYEASQAGVRITLLVRGICGLIPGLEGVSENIRVRSIVGQLLEHSRIFYFHNANDPLVFMGSADLMPRNLDRRVEVVFPVEEPELKTRLIRTLELMWRDNTNAWECDGNGRYQQVEPQEPRINSQRELSQRSIREWREAEKNIIG